MDAWSKFLSDVDKATRKCGDMPFFRGHTNSMWKLVPSLFRKKFYEKSECHMYYDFLSYSGPLYESKRSSWEVLFDMRHCGVPTRLLDWTETLAVALYFSIHGRVLRPAIWILNPFKLNEQVAGLNLINPISDLDYDYFLAYITQRDIPPNGPLAMIPPKQNKRQFAQKGVFTLHGRISDPLEKQFPDCVRMLYIPKPLIPRIKKFLKFSGVNEYSMFPDFDGLGRHIVELYKS